MQKKENKAPKIVLIDWGKLLKEGKNRVAPFATEQADKNGKALLIISLIALTQPPSVQKE